MRVGICVSVSHGPHFPQLVVVGVVVVAAAAAAVCVCVCVCVREFSCVHFGGGVCLHRTIPLTRVFSVRNHAKRAAPKTFERALPFAQHMLDGAGCAVLAVDGAYTYCHQ